MLGEESRHAWVKTFENSNLPKVICKRRSGDNILEITIFVIFSYTIYFYISSKNNCTLVIKLILEKKSAKSSVMNLVLNT